MAAARWLSASLALLKALAAAAQWAATAGRPSWILAADTVVCAPDGALLGQPADRAGAAAMLVRLAGRPHRVVSAAVLLQAQQGRQRRWIETSTVAVRALGPAELRRYLDSGAWRGKAGGYGVQDEPPIAQVQAGSRSNAMGLPLERLLPVLRELGFVDPLPSGAGAAGSGAPVSA
ncbi:MAG: hypothetical protein KatS3mg102_2882 [Planctomycetota bacterium]|nr:MAG: hypothetical protein KatS3mg102_2882 [Planctomycetota bacterium]